MKLVKSYNLCIKKKQNNNNNNNKAKQKRD